MALPAPNLDDRRFQELVDDAKRLVQQRCPEWTDHNVSDPGVTLIELFAWMTDQLLYRLNRVPDRNYVKFLDLIGVRLFPPTAARADVTFWLSAPQPGRADDPGRDARSRPCAPSARRRSSFTTDERARDRRRASSTRVASHDRPTTSPQPRGRARRAARASSASTQTPKPGDALLLGLSDAAPSCAVALRFDCDDRGHRRRPAATRRSSGRRGTATDWAACELDRDETGGLNRAGDVVAARARPRTRPR